MKLPEILYFVILFSVLSSCNANKTLSGIYTAKDCDQKYQTVSLITITAPGTIYNGRFVEVNGYYQWGTEESAISDYLVSQKLIWIEFTSGIADSLENKNKSPNENVFDKMSGRRIKIRGTVDTSDHEHLGQYAAAIKYICYLQVY